eukprot:5233414-Amphidinium_carterae.1
MVAPYTIKEDHAGAAAVQVVAIEYLLRDLPIAECNTIQFASVTVNRATGFYAHRDAGNRGQSLLRAFGTRRLSPACHNDFPNDFW